MGRNEKTKKHRAYEIIKSMIILDHVRQEDQFTEVSLSKTLGMGRTPIREALNLLLKDGLIQLIPNKGFIINRISSDDLVRLYQIREVLDGLAARLAAVTIDQSDVDRIENKYLHGSQPDWESGRRLSSELHSVIYESCGNPHLLDVYKGLALKVDLAMNSLWKLWLKSGSTELLQRRNREHAEIIRCLKMRDPDESERTSKEHIANTIKDILRLITGQRTE